LSPGGKFGGMCESDVEGLYRTLIDMLEPLNLSYLHVLETATDAVNEMIRDSWSGTLIVNPSFVDLEQMGTVGAQFADRPNADRWLARGADLVSFGRYFISNPDLVRRMREDLELADPEISTYYSGGDEGYIDYPEWAPAGSH
jgi:N-ethylmaleimide reductase